MAHRDSSGAPSSRLLPARDMRCKAQHWRGHRRATTWSSTSSRMSRSASRTTASGKQRHKICTACATGDTVRAGLISHTCLQVEKVLASNKPDVVVYAAGESPACATELSADADPRSNPAGNLVAAAANVGAWVLYVSCDRCDESQGPLQQRVPHQLTRGCS